MIFNDYERKVYVSKSEYIDKSKGFSLSNINVKDNTRFACKVASDHSFHVSKEGQLMLGPYEIHITR